MFNQQAKSEQTKTKPKSATEILSYFYQHGRRESCPIPSDFSKELELSIIEKVFCIVYARFNHGPDIDRKITIDLDKDIADKITQFYRAEQGSREPYSGSSRMSLNDFVLMNCGLWKILENLYFDTRTSRIYYTENGDGSIDFKLELEIQHNNINEIFEARLSHWARIEADELKAKEMHELYVWMKEQKEDDTSKKILSIVTEIGTDVKMVIGFAKDLMGELVSIKTKLASIGKSKVKTNRNKTV